MKSLFPVWLCWCLNPSPCWGLEDSIYSNLHSVLLQVTPYLLKKTPFSLNPGTSRPWETRTEVSSFCQREKVMGNGVCVRLMWPQSTLKGRILSFHAKGRAIAGNLAGTSQQLIEQQFQPLQGPIDGKVTDASQAAGKCDSWYWSQADLGESVMTDFC